jgi:hypothetical protein
MNELEFKGKRILWGEYWDVPTSSLNIPRLRFQGLLPHLDQASPEEAEPWSYADWVDRGMPLTETVVLPEGGFGIKT